jgi:hypothetical protein
MRRSGWQRMRSVAAAINAWWRFVKWTCGPNSVNRAVTRASLPIGGRMGV